MEFRTPGGALVPGAPGPTRPTAELVEENRRLGLTIGPDTGKCLRDGQAMDLGMAIDTLLSCEAGDDWR